MRVALQVIAFNVDPWINAMLANAAPFVDKIFLAYPPRPWGYSAEARTRLVNPTLLNSIDLHTVSCDVEVVHGDWMLEEDTRNCLLDLARNQGFDWMVIQDADEFYTSESWQRLLRVMSEDIRHDLLITPWLNFWKSPEFVIENRGSGIKSLNEGFALRLKDTATRFVKLRTSNANTRLVVDEPCYHYGYVMDDASMLKKLSTWAHSKDVTSIRLWFELKWRRWDENTLLLHPSSPAYWLKATRFPLPQPDFAYSFLELYGRYDATKGLFWSLVDCLWNFAAITNWRSFQLRRLLRNSILNSPFRAAYRQD